MPGAASGTQSPLVSDRGVTGHIPAHRAGTRVLCWDSVDFSVRARPLSVYSKAVAPLEGSQTASHGVEGAVRG